jgi:hypothetical protein
MVATSWDIEELRAELDRYKTALVEAGKVPNTVQTYVDRADRFIRWLAGEYDPEQGRSAARTQLDGGTRLAATRSHRR